MLTKNLPLALLAISTPHKTRNNLVTSFKIKMTPMFLTSSVLIPRPSPDRLSLRGNLLLFP